MRDFHLTIRLLCAGFVVLLVGAVAAWAQAPGAGADQQAGVTKKAQAFVDAFAKGDANALAAFWTPDGDYMDVNGRVLKGRQAIAQDFAEFFAANKGMKLRIDVQSMRSPTPDTAIEDGVTSVLPADGGLPERTCYRNFLVKKDGEWFLESVQESAYVPPTNRNHLEPLGWLVGEWVEDTKQPQAGRIAFEWSADQNYIVGNRAVAIKGLMLDSGTDRIGWDPAARMIRSWNFDSNGAFSHGTWKPDGDKWVISSSAVTAEGQLASATTTLTRADADSVTLQTKVQVAGEKEPREMPPLKMKRMGHEDQTAPAAHASAAGWHGAAH